MKLIHLSPCIIKNHFINGHCNFKIFHKNLRHKKTPIHNKEGAIIQVYLHHLTDISVSKLKVQLAKNILALFEF